MRTRWREPSPSSRSIRPPRCETFTISSSIPARASASINPTTSGRPPACSRGFGTRSLSGRMRSPRPAASIIAFTLAAPACLVRAAELGLALLQLVEQARERRELAVALRDGPRVAQEARRILEITALAVAIADAGEDAQHLEMALQPHPLEIAVE